MFGRVYDGQCDRGVDQDHYVHLFKPLAKTLINEGIKSRAYTVETLDAPLGTNNKSTFRVHHLISAHAIEIM